MYVRAAITRHNVSENDKHLLPLPFLKARP